MTDKDIVKALEHCASGCTSEACRGCPFDEKSVCTENENASAVYALDLINRQKAEIERLEKLADYQMQEVKERKQKYEEAVNNLLDLADTASNETKQARAEAIKEFASRLKERYSNIPLWGTVAVAFMEDILKEMVGEQT